MSGDILSRAGHVPVNELLYLDFIYLFMLQAQGPVSQNRKNKP